MQGQLVVICYDVFYNTTYLDIIKSLVVLVSPALGCCSCSSCLRVTSLELSKLLKRKEMFYKS